MSTVLRKSIIISTVAASFLLSATINQAIANSQIAKIYPKGSIVESMGVPAPLATIKTFSLPKIKQKIVLPKGYVNEFIVFNKLVKGRSKHARREIHCLSRNIFHEAARENYIGKLAVANVTQTRLTDKRWPGTFCKVVTQGYVPGKKWGCQFSWNCDKRPDKVYLHSKRKGKRVLRGDIYAAWVDSIEIAIDVYDKKAKDVTAGATHYYNPAVCYKWSIRVDKHGNKLIAKTYKDFINRVKPQTVDCHPKWGYKGLKNGSFIRTPSAFAKNGKIDSHLFLIERPREELASK